ncbi:MAG: PPC domain-containing protein, partial [Planctomycetes bacterium]|nr:PPC domain-containing protein [Planctomycetota bacterium]
YSMDKPEKSSPLAKYHKSIDKKRQLNQQLVDQLQLSLKVPANCPPGFYEMRAVSPQGVSQPIRFVISSLTQVKEEEPNDNIQSAYPLPPLPACVNGQILPGESDIFSFSGKKNESIGIQVYARALIPYLADAVPGWFQAVISVTDSRGRELAYADDYFFQPDPYLLFTPPKDGTYYLTIRDAIYRGRDDFVYRIEMGQLPHVKAIYPLGGNRNDTTEIELMGDFLPYSKLSFNPQSKGYNTLKNNTLTLNELSLLSPPQFALSSLTEVREETMGNDIQEIPRVINGRILKKGESDRYQFHAKQGEQIHISIQARQLGSPIDAAIRIFSPEGKRLKTFDDHPDITQGMQTHHADPYTTFDIPADGVYSIEVYDIQNQYGPEYAYRLILKLPVAHFALRVSPSAISIPPSGTGVFMIHAHRSSAMKQEIRLSLDPTLPGVTLSGTTIAPESDSVVMTLSASGRSRKSNYKQVRLVGKAKIGGEEVIVQAQPAEDMMQAFLNRHLVPTEELLIVSGKGNRMLVESDEADQTIALSSLNPAKIDIPMPLNKWWKTYTQKGQWFVEALAPVTGISAKVTDYNGKAGTLTTELIVENKKDIAQKGNLVFRISVIPSTQKNKKPRFICFSKARPYSFLDEENIK